MDPITIIGLVLGVIEALLKIIAFLQAHPDLLPHMQLPVADVEVRLQNAATDLRALAHPAPEAP